MAIHQQKSGMLDHMLKTYSILQLQEEKGMENY